MARKRHARARVERWLVWIAAATAITPALLELVDQALAHCHYQDGPFGLDRRGDRVALRFGFCNPPARHRELVDRLRSMPEVIELRLS